MAHAHVPVPADAALDPARLSTNLIIYMTRVMHYSPAFASAQLTLFEGTAYLTPILGAWLADAAWGRYKTILVFSIIYMVVRGCLSALHDFPCARGVFRGLAG